MDDSLDTLGMATGPLGPDSITGMEPTASAPDSRVDDRSRGGPGAVDLSFLAPSTRCGSLGRMGEYEISGVIGRGASGVVLKGYDRALEREVAVKVQDPSLALNRRLQARFLKEARAAAAINHPSVVTIYKVNIVRERPYLAMELVSRSLRDRIRCGDPLTIDEVLRISLQVAEGLAAAHARGVLHRDIKPANILLEDGGPRAKISDFGLAMEGLKAEAPLAPDRVAGTPAYMSPEQVKNEPLDARSDLFSLGCVIFAMLAGRSPFGGATASEAVASVLHHHPGPPSPSDHACWGPLADLILRLLAKDPRDRPGSAQEVAAALKALIAAPPRGPESDAPPPPPPATRLAPPAPRPRPAWLWPSLAIASLAVAAFIARDQIMPAAGPPPPGAVADPPPPGYWAIGVGPGADFPSLSRALASPRVGPGARLRLMDPGRYEGAIRLTDPARFRDLTIESARGATLASSGEAVVTIAGCPGVTLRDLAIETRADQFAVRVSGPADGVTIDNIRTRSPGHSRWTQVFVTDGALGSPARPIVVANSTFHAGHGGVTIQGSEAGAVGRVEVRDNRFLGDDEHVLVVQDVHDVKVVGNRFAGGRGVTLNFGPGQGRGVVVANNTFLRPSLWINPADSGVNSSAVVICNNAILEAGTLDKEAGPLALLARGPWSVHHNRWEPAPGAAAIGDPLAEVHPRLDVLSRDPERAGFLRPGPGSDLAAGGAGGALPGYVGALPPPPGPGPGPAITRPARLAAPLP